MTVQELNSTYSYLREAMAPWRAESLARGKNRCAITGKKCGLTVHHNDVNFKTIMREAFTACNLIYSPDVHDFTREELERLSAVCLSLHFNHGLGIVLHYLVHKDLHRRYGVVVSEADFKEYKKHRLKKKAA